MHLGALPTTDGTATRLALARLEREGHDGAQLLALSGLSAVLLRRRQRFGLANQLRFLDLAAVSLKDPCLGVRIAGELELLDLGLLYYVVASARTAREGLVQLARYVGISNDSISIAVVETGGQARVSLTFAGTLLPRSERQFAELVVAAMLRAFREITLEPVMPIAVWFAHPAGEAAPDVAAALGCAFALGRFLYASGSKSTKGADGRMVGALLGGLSALGLYGVAIVQGLATFAS
jgi:hypothetical protein